MAGKGIKVIAILNAIIGFIGGLILFGRASNSRSDGGILVGYGFLVIFGSIIASVFMYSFGELCKNVSIIANKISNQNQPNITQNQINDSSNPNDQNKSIVNAAGRTVCSKCYKVAFDIEKGKCLSCGYTSPTNDQKTSETDVDFDGISSLQARAKLYNNNADE